MRFGITLPTGGVGNDPRALIDLAVEAEAAGWDGVFLWDVTLGYPDYGDDINTFHEAWVLLSAIAMKTERVLIGTMITPIVWRSPVIVAKQASTLQSLSNGRFVLSVGLGAPPDKGTYFFEENNRRVRAQLLDESLGILDACWSGEPIRANGLHYKSRNDPVMLPVVTPRPTVWVVGAWNLDRTVWSKQRSFRRALRWDGLLPHIFDGAEMKAGAFEPEDIRALSAEITTERAAPFDLIVEGGEEDLNASSETVRALADAGATWWLEGIWTSMYRHPGDPTVMRERIRQGPPVL